MLGHKAACSAREAHLIKTEKRIYKRIEKRREERIDVDAILASLPDELNDVGDDPWGGANLADCGGPCCHRE